MDHRPIGIFDSGLGGLNGLRALRSFLPDENVVYFADSGRLPYGAKSRAQLRVMAQQDLDFLSSFGVKASLVACGTLSSNAGDLLEAWHIPAFGVLTASAEHIRRLDINGPVAVAATAASIRSGGYQAAIQARCPGSTVLGIPCPDFVPLIESGHLSPDDPLLRDAVARYLQPAKDAGASILVLGCTHYGLIEATITAFLGPDVRLISAAESGAIALCSHLLKTGKTGGSGETKFYTSGDMVTFARAAGFFLGRDARELAVEAIPPQPVPDFNDSYPLTGV